MCKESTVWVLRKYYIYLIVLAGKKMCIYGSFELFIVFQFLQNLQCGNQMLFCGNHLKAAMFQTLSFKNCFNTTKKMDRLKCCLHTPLFFQLVVDIPKVAWNIRQFVYSFSTGQLARNDHEYYSHRMDIFVKGVKLTNPLPAVISSLANSLWFQKWHLWQPIQYKGLAKLAVLPNYKPDALPSFATSSKSAIIGNSKYVDFLCQKSC